MWNNGEVNPWIQGVRDGRADAEKDGLKPPRSNRQGQYDRPYPREWSDPHVFDPQTDRGDSKGEEDLIEETRTDAYTNTDLAAEDEARWTKEAEEGQHSHKESDSDSDDDEEDDENETLYDIQQRRAIQATTEAVLLAGQCESKELTVKQKVRRYCGSGPDARYQEVHKATVCKWINDGRKGLSADRGVRVQQGRAVPEQFSTHKHKWEVERYNDVACLFDDIVQVGKIVRIRKKMSRGWVEYNRPIVLQRERTNLGNLYFTCAWYTREEGEAEIFSFDKTSTCEVHVLSIVCPVSLQFTANNKYLLPHNQATILKENLAGDQHWKPVSHTSHARTRTSRGTSRRASRGT